MELAGNYVFSRNTSLCTCDLSLSSACLQWPCLPGHLVFHNTLHMGISGICLQLHICVVPSAFFSARTMRAKVRRDVIWSEGMSKNIMILNPRGLSTGWCSENDVMWLLNLPVGGSFIKTLDAYQTAATYLWTCNMEGEIMKNELCLIPVKCCSSGGALRELVITFLQTEKLWKVMFYQRFKRLLQRLAE